MMITEQEILNASILIVDDQQSNVSLLEDILHESGYTNIATTVDPLEVCALYQKDRQDLILLDLQMPVMDGFQVMEELKKNRNGGLSSGTGDNRSTGSQTACAGRWR
jgi:CheY-like chemotaxis protein